MDLQGLLARLSGARKAGNGYAARYPAHDDKRPSLSINADDEDRILLHCHAGCKTRHSTRTTFCVE
jgi:putative DNA primase/helicase